ncbi:hypothetical protein ECAE60S_02628 [Eoetvoesiella caeni]
MPSTIVRAFTKHMRTKASNTYGAAACTLVGFWIVERWGAAPALKDGKSVSMDPSCLTLFYMRVRFKGFMPKARIETISI